MDLALIVEDTASSASANRALVSLKTMQDAKWLAGDVLEVVIDEEDTSARRVALLVAWPSVLVAPSAIHVSRRALLHWTNLDGTSVPRRVRCTVVAASAVVEAKSVTVDVANNVDALADMMDLDDTALITLVRDTLRDMRYITASSPSFSVSYMAQKLQLRIDECIPSSTRFLEQSPLLHLGTAMKDLKLNDGADASCSATTQNFYHITRDTSVLLSPAFRGRRKEVAAKSTSARQQHGEATTYGSIGGLQREIAAVREIVDLPLTQPEVYTRFGLMPPKGVLLFGPPGMEVIAIFQFSLGQFFPIYNRHGKDADCKSSRE